MNKFLYIVNPTSGKGRGKKTISQIHSFCKSHNVNYKLEETKYNLHAREITQKNLAHYDAVIAVGGDGTVNEVVNGLFPHQNTIFGVLPVGSGNDFVKNISLHNTIKENMSLIHSNSHNSISNVDLGIVDYTEKDSVEQKSHVFANNLGIGFDAYVGHLNQNNKTLSGLSSYILAVIKALFNYKMINLELNLPQDRISGEKLLVAIGNGISSGGGFYLNPNAKIDDGLLDITVVDKVTRRRLMTALPMALINKLEKIREAKMYISKEFEIKLNSPYFVHCDGEIITQTLEEAKISIKPKAIRVITKKG